VRFPRVRFTMLQLMTAVAVVGAILHAYRTLPSFPEFFHDDPFHAFGSVKRVWTSGPAPSITVDLFEGGITVVPGADGVITADIVTGASTKWSQSAANEALEAISLGLNQRGDFLRPGLRERHVGLSACLCLLNQGDQRFRLRTRQVRRIDRSRDPRPAAGSGGTPDTDATGARRTGPDRGDRRARGHPGSCPARRPSEGMGTRVL
jgi:hypothetical protein